MKRLIITRHAKSSWDNPRLKDIDRPLNSRGQNDAARMAKRLRGLGFVPQLMISSNAVRAHQTAKIMHKELKLQNDIIVDKSLYLGDIEEFIHATLMIPPQYDTVMLFGHNPGITYFANVICEANIDNVPTAGVLVIDVDSNSWADTDISKLRLETFLYPKQEDQYLD